MNVFHELTETYRNRGKRKAFIITMHKIHSIKVTTRIDHFLKIGKNQPKTNIGTDIAYKPMN